ncbi:MAG: ribosome small subunit-dependent GTPase A [Gemmatimonadetes bacterium]|nr:ribosome small subunit-dependent GTPase A [Gemmatimonadota bacterium]
MVEASLRGRVKQKDARIVSVGDLVEIESIEGEPRISRLLPRESALTRHGVSKRREQVIVANVDQVAIVVAATAPEPDLSMVDRLLALSELSELRPLLVLNKAELLGLAPETELATARPEAASAPATPLGDVAGLGYDTLVTSAETGAGVEELAARLSDRVTVLTGQSGVGKSSLLNALIPGLGLRVGEISERRGRGRHTTVASALYPYPAGGYVADTPGLQYVALWGIAPTDVDRGFVEISRLSESCRFADCRHRSEPSCAVRAGLDEGLVTVRRYESYERLLTEAEEGVR